MGRVWGGGGPSAAGTLCAVAGYLARVDELGYRAAMRRHGLGDQVRVITGGDSERDGHRAAVDLTSVSQEAAVQAQSAVRAAVDRLEGHVVGTTDTVLDPRLVVRSSSSPPSRLTSQ